MGLYVQYGSGWSCPDGWLNYDASPTLRFERLPLIGRLYTRNASRFPEKVRYGDIVKGLPLPAASCSGVYASHVLEHLAREEFEAALRNTFTLLEPGGVFRCIVPDLRERARRYLEGVSQGEADANDRFLESSCLGSRRRRRGLAGLTRAWLSNEPHLWMWDEASMRDKLESAGFVGVRRCQFGDSDDEMFARVEARDRFIDTDTRIVECAMEARRP